MSLSLESVSPLPHLSGGLLEIPMDIFSTINFLSIGRLKKYIKYISEHYGFLHREQKAIACVHNYIFLPQER